EGDDAPWGRHPDAVVGVSRPRPRGGRPDGVARRPRASRLSILPGELRAAVQRGALSLAAGAGGLAPALPLGAGAARARRAAGAVRTRRVRARSGRRPGV